MTKHCLSCGKPVPARTSKDGTPQNSLWLRQHDEFEHFCSMRCAALYGIRSANIRKALGYDK